MGVKVHKNLSEIQACTALNLHLILGKIKDLNGLGSSLILVRSWELFKCHLVKTESTPSRSTLRVVGRQTGTVVLLKTKAFFKVRRAIS